MADGAVTRTPGVAFSLQEHSGGGVSNVYVHRLRREQDFNRGDRTISDANSTRTESPYKACFPTRQQLEQWLTFWRDADYDAKYDYINRNDPFTLSPGDKVRIVSRDDSSFQDGKTVIELYLIPNKAWHSAETVRPALPRTTVLYSLANDRFLRRVAHHSC